ncbi:MAG: segregation/condensation protein A [bacterium]|nr:segregation/condensation protein A [bacterium]
MVQIKVEQFEGPLDLLLKLIEDQELDITTVSLATVTEQFLGYIKNLQEKNPLTLADFLVIAAKLLVIKSKALLPTLDLGVEEEEEAFDLTQQLLLYKKYKEAGKFLKSFEMKRHQSWIREVGFVDKVTFVPDPAATPHRLAQSLFVLAKQLQEITKLPQDIIEEVVSISEKIDHIQKLISEKMESSLSSLLKNSGSKTEVIVTFLALLELIKQRILTVEQNEAFSDILIKKVNN